MRELKPDEVKVDLEEEILKMARADGIQNIASLAVPVSMPRREYYAAVIRAHYRAIDIGWSQCMAGAGKPLRRAILAAWTYAFGSGILLGASVTYALLRFLR